MQTLWKRTNTTLTRDEFIIKEYDREIDLIKAFYDQVNENKNDFISGWNSVFDNLTLKNRIKKHGIDPKDIICPPEMKYKFVYHL